MSRFGSHLRSNLVAYVALFCSLSLGTAWAATQLTRNSVKSKHIAAGQVKRSDLAQNAVNSSRVANSSLRAADFAPGELPAGAPGQTGPTGPTGPAGSALAFARVNADKTIDAAYSQNIVALSPVNVVGAYCFNVTTSQSPRNVVATIDLAGGTSPTDQIWATVIPAVVANNCGGLAGADLLVGTTSSSGNGVNRPFYINVN